MFDIKKVSVPEGVKEQFQALTQNSEFMLSLVEQVNQYAATEKQELKSKLSEFRTNNIELQKQLKQFEGVDPEKLEQFKGIDPDKLKGENQQKDTVITELERKINDLTQSIEQSRINEAALTAISKYNQQHKSTPVVDGAAELLMEKIRGNAKLVDGKLVMQQDGKDFITENGVGTPDQWIEKVIQPSMPFLFKQPAGSGATGGTASAGGAATITRKEFEAISDPAKRVEIAKTHTIISQ